MPMNAWFSRVLTKASFDPSGDHCGLLCRPHALMKGTPPVSIAAMLFVVVAWKICPSFTNTTCLPLGESSGAPPPRPPPPAKPGVLVMTARRTAPVPSVFAAHTERSPPSGSCDGFATHPSRFGPEPRTNVAMLPSSGQPHRADVHAVVVHELRDATGLKSGADATYTLRMPRSYETHAMRSALRAALTSSGERGDEELVDRSRSSPSPLGASLRAGETSLRAKGAKHRAGRGGERRTEVGALMGLDGGQTGGVCLWLTSHPPPPLRKA
jgi:hypothetical protein